MNEQEKSPEVEKVNRLIESSEERAKIAIQMFSEMIEGLDGLLTQVITTGRCMGVVDATMSDGTKLKGGIFIREVIDGESENGELAQPELNGLNSSEEQPESSRGDSGDGQGKTPNQDILDS